MFINIDAKEDVIDESIALAKKLGVLDHVLIKSADGPRRLRNAGFVEGDVYFMPILPKDASTPLSERINYYKDIELVAYELLFDDLNYLIEGVESINQTNKRIWVNTMKPIYSAGLTDRDAMKNPESVWGRLISSGANMIQTDSPRHLIHFLQKINRRC